MITLIRTPLISDIGSFNNEPTPPLGLAYLAGALQRENYNVSVIDATGLNLDNIERIEGTNLKFCGISAESIVKLIPKDVKIIGISAMFSHEWTYVKYSIKKIRGAFPDAVIIGGGEHFSALQEYCLRDCPELDYICVGEGDETILEFCERIFSDQPVEGIAGISHLDISGDFVEAIPRKRIRNLDELPWPAWDLFPLKNYLDRSIGAGASLGRNMPMMVSRGCPYKCTFCSNVKMWTNRYNLRSVSDVITEIKHYIKIYQATGIQFYDLTAIVKRKWILEFCEALDRENIKIDWSLPSGTRSEVLDKETLPALSKANLRYLVYAPESTSPKTLELIKKKINLDKMIKSLKIAISSGITVRTNLIIGFPFERRRDVYKTLMGQVKFILLGVDEAPLFLFQPYPGTELFDYLCSKNRVHLCDQYFNNLASLSNGNTRPPRETFCENIGRIELFIYRIAFMSLGYILSYMVRPKRIFRSFKNIFFTDRSTTVFEQRLKDKIRARSKSAPSKGTA